MAIEQLPEFIKSEQKKGVPDETIRLMLGSNGWSNYEISQAYAYINGTPVPVFETKKRKRRAFIYVGLLVIALVVWLLFR